MPVETSEQAQLQAQLQALLDQVQPQINADYEKDKRLYDPIAMSFDRIHEREMQVLKQTSPYGTVQGNGAEERHRSTLSMFARMGGSTIGGASQGSGHPSTPPLSSDSPQLTTVHVPIGSPDPSLARREATLRRIKDFASSSAAFRAFRALRQQTGS